jgi:hypothetical protein
MVLIELMSLASRAQLFLEMDGSPQLALWATDLPSASLTGWIITLPSSLESFIPFPISSPQFQWLQSTTYWR